MSDIISEIREELLTCTEIKYKEFQGSLIPTVEADKVFERDEEILWQCRNCGFVLSAKKAPLKCPACLHPQAYFEPMKQNY